jgi:hypothetical protein
MKRATCSTQVCSFQACLLAQQKGGPSHDAHRLLVTVTIPCAHEQKGTGGVVWRDPMGQGGGSERKHE